MSVTGSSCNGDHVGGLRGELRSAGPAVGGAGLNQTLLLARHRDLQAPPDGEGGEVKQQQLGAAAQVPAREAEGRGSV